MAVDRTTPSVDPRAFAELDTAVALLNLAGRWKERYDAIYHSSAPAPGAVARVVPVKRRVV